jgi:hypothetical protein
MKSDVEPKPGDKVILKGVPPNWLDDLPKSDQGAITRVIGTAILLLDYDEDGRAELEFTDAKGIIHAIFVDPKYISATRDRDR